MALPGGENALEKIRDARPHLVVLDMTSDRMNALEVLQRFREDDNGKDVSFILKASSKDEKARILETYPEGIRVLCTPIPREAFLNSVEELIGA